MQELVIEARNSYLKYLRDGGQRVKLRKPKHRHTPDVIHPSSLGLCPLKAALRDAVPPYPELAPDGDVQWRMEFGTRIGELMAEAFIFKYGKRVKTEKLLKRWGLRGYADILLDEKTIIEVKMVRENYAKLQTYQVLQVMAYGYMLGSADMFIVTANRNAVKTYRLDGDWDTGFKAVDDVTGIPAGPPFISRMDFLEELQRHRLYMLGKRDNPYPDFLNMEYSWLCIEKSDKQAGRLGTYRAHCEHFCQHPTTPGQEHQYALSDGKFVSLETVF